MKPFRTLLTVSVAALALVCTAWAGAPVGDPDSIDPTVFKPVKAALDKRGYIAHREREAFKPAIGAFLWNNRHFLVSIDVPKEREVDLVVCLLAMREGDRRVRAIGGPAVGPWCERQLRKIPSN